MSGIYKAYRSAGADFLALRLGRLFTRVENVEDQALHNDMVKDVLEIIEGEEQSFFKSLADSMLYQKVDKKKRFLYHVACRALTFGMKKG